MVDRKEYYRQYHLKNKEKRNQQSRDYYQKNREHEIKRVAEYLKEHKDKQDRARQQYRRTHRAKVNGWKKSYYDRCVNKGISIWEKEYGKIPEGYCLIYKDGNKKNLDLNNLMLISNSDMMIIVGNRIELSCGEEVLNTSIILAQLSRKRRKLEKEKL